ncbi:alpha/beta fold hydrolase [Streptomyces spiralis]
MGGACRPPSGRPCHPGGPRSTRPGPQRPTAGPYGTAAHADDMAAVVDAPGVGRAVLTGHSMGAFTAALTALFATRTR